MGNESSASRQTLLRRDRMRMRHRTRADELRHLWRLAARAHWRTTQPWWAAGVDGLVRAMADGRDPQPCAAQLGRERAEAQIGLAQTLDDLNVLYRLLPAGAPSANLVRATVNAWTTQTATRPGPPRLTAGAVSGASGGPEATVADPSPGGHNAAPNQSHFPRSPGMFVRRAPAPEGAQPDVLSRGPLVPITAEPVR